MGEEFQPRRAKEAAKLTLPKYPASAAAYREWRLGVALAVVSASGRPEAASRWAHQATADSVPAEALADSAGFLTLDIKLSAALTESVTGEMKAKVIDAQERAWAGDAGILSGRQILRMVHESFQVDKRMGALRAYEDILVVRLKRAEHGRPGALRAYLGQGENGPSQPPAH